MLDKHVYKLIAWIKVCASDCMPAEHLVKAKLAAVNRKEFQQDFAETSKF
jgi:hypothetical protein